MTLEPTILVAIASALVVLGVFLGSLRSSTRSAHHRLDKLEGKLTDEFRELRRTLKESIESAYLHCPLAREQHGRAQD